MSARSEAVVPASPPSGDDTTDAADRYLAMDCEHVTTDYLMGVVEMMLREECAVARIECTGVADADALARVAALRRMSGGAMVVHVHSAKRRVIDDDTALPPPTRRRDGTPPLGADDESIECD